MIPSPRRAFAELLESRLLFTAGELVRNGAFEGAVAAADWARGSAWQAGALGHTNYHGGAGYAYNGTSAGSYIHNTSGAAGEMYQELTIPAGTVNPTLQFWTKITTEETTTITAFDTMQVQVRNTSGAVLATLTTLSNLNAGSTSGPYTASGKYNLHTFSMSPYIGQTIRIAFKVTTDAAKGTMFRVDDVSLAPPVPVVPGTSGQVVGYLPDYRYSLFGQIDLDLVTHLNYFSVGFSSTGALTAPSATFNSHVDTVVAAAHARGVGVSITTGPGQPYSAMGASATARAKLVSDLKAYVLAHNLDGVDIDWEPPAKGIDQVNYGLLIDDLHVAFNPIGKKITAAVNPWTKEIPVQATKLMNWLNVMCYDFHYANNSTYEAATDGMLQWTYYGVDKNKLMMGTPFYGRSGTSWSDTRSKTYNGFLTDYKAMHEVYPGPNVDSFVDTAGATWYINGVTTIGRKMAFIRDNSYAGAMIWELGQDHWDAGLSYDRYSLLPIINTMMRPPAWLAPTAGSRFALVEDQQQFLMHSGTATVSSAMSTSNPNLNVNVWANARLVSSASQKFGSLVVDNLGDMTIQSGGNRNLHTNTLSLGASAKLDLRDNDLVVNNGSFSQIQQLVLSGFSSTPDATKAGIISTTGQNSDGVTILALFDNALVGASDWDGIPISPAAIVGKYTFFGDVNIDGQVTGDDYAVIDSNLNTTPLAGLAWMSGDANLDGIVTGDDYAVIDSNLGLGTGNPLSPQSLLMSRPRRDLDQSPARSTML